jgi:hypothetical protein
MTILETLVDPKLFGRHFDHESWAWWRSFLAALFGLTLEGLDLKRYKDATCRESPPDEPASEAYAIVGRRGGKSRVAALVGVYLACFRDHSVILSHGERGVVMILAPDRRQARVVIGYVRALPRCRCCRRWSSAAAVRQSTSATTSVSKSTRPVIGP